MTKIVPIAGDVTEPELGIDAVDQETLTRHVSVVFHSAATVKFDEALKLSVTINMLGSERLLHLCHRMINLDVSIVNPIDNSVLESDNFHAYTMLL